MEPIAFNRPYCGAREFEYMSDAIARGHISGDGFYTKQCHEALRRLTQAPEVLLTTSCTHALEMAALLLDIGPGDEVILPSFTFVSTVNAFALRGAVPVFVDIRPDTLNIDETRIESAITERTRAIVVVHYAGVPCEMHSILKIADAHGVAVVEDAAHALGSTYREDAVGALGALGTLSFHETKNIQCGEGGALLIGDQALIERAEILREKGTNRSKFFRGQVDKYTWVDVGSSYLPSDLLAAYLFGQLEAFESIQSKRMHVWNRYQVELAGWCTTRGIAQPAVPAHVSHPAHLYYLLLPDLETRQRFIAHLSDQKIKAVFHYVPLHTSPMGRRIAPSADCPVTESISDRLVRLPLFPDLSDDQIDWIVDSVIGFEP